MKKILGGTFIFLFIASFSWAGDIQDDPLLKLYNLYYEIKNASSLTDVQKHQYESKINELLGGQKTTVEDFMLIYPNTWELFVPVVEKKIRAALTGRGINGLRDFMGRPESPGFFYTDDSCKETGSLNLDKAKATAAQFAETVLKTMPEIDAVRVNATCDITTGKKQVKEFVFKRTPQNS